MGFKKLASSKPTSSTLTTLYTEDATHEATVMLNMTNSSTSDDDVAYVYFADSGDTNGDISNLVFQGTVQSSGTVQIGGYCLGNSQFVEVKSDNGNITFSLFGNELES